MRDHDMSVMPVDGAERSWRWGTGLGCWLLAYAAGAWGSARPPLRACPRHIDLGRRQPAPRVCRRVWSVRFC